MVEGLTPVSTVWLMSLLSLRPLMGTSCRGGIDRQVELDQSQTIGEITTLLSTDGYRGSFVLHDTDHLRDRPDGRLWSANEVVIRDVFRVEGQSDPDEMAVVYALETADGDRGVIIDAFGPYGDPVLADLIARIPVQRQRDPATE